jgi:hypothetical protein
MNLTQLVFLPIKGVNSTQLVFLPVVGMNSTQLLFLQVKGMNSAQLPLPLQSLHKIFTAPYSSSTELGT